MRRAFLSSIVVCTAMLSVAQQVQPLSPNNRMVDVGGFKLHVITAGRGSPAVVFESGFGDTAHSWSKIAPKVSQYTTTVVYDRAGIGQSELSNAPRTFQQITDELHRMLQKSGVSPPYVLVGHSLGGAVIRNYVAKYPSEVSGLVFEEPFTEGILKHSPEWFAKYRRLAEGQVNDAGPGEKAETLDIFAEADRGFSDILPVRLPKNLPVTLLIARQDRSPQWEQAVLETYFPAVLASQNGGLIMVPSSGHYIHLEQPDVVLDAIRRVVFPSVANVIRQSIASDGIAATLPRVREMKDRYPLDLFNERVLNNVAYTYLYNEGTPEWGVRDPKTALELFNLAIEFYPKSGKAYASIGEAYEVAGNREAALRNYRKSLELDPQNVEAIGHIKQLENSPSVQNWR